MTTPRVGAYVIVPRDCPMAYSLTGDDDIEVRLGTRTDGFELVFEREALAHLVAMADRALADREAANATPMRRCQ